MFYVYVLYSVKDKGLYIGFTSDLKRRIIEHRNKSVRSTRSRLPIKLIYYEAFLILEDAKAREKYLKSGYGRTQLKSILKVLFKKLIIR